jgi:hypothetical protein
MRRSDTHEEFLCRYALNLKQRSSVASLAVCNSKGTVARFSKCRHTATWANSKIPFQWHRTEVVGQAFYLSFLDRQARCLSLQYNGLKSCLIVSNRRMRYPNCELDHYEISSEARFKKLLKLVSWPRPRQGKVSSASRRSVSALGRPPTTRRRTSPFSRFRLPYATQASMYEAKSG